MSLWSWVRALTEAKEKGKGHAPIGCEWDHPSSEWARGWGAYKKRPLFFFVRAPPPGPLRRGVVPLTSYRGMSLALFFRLRESSNPRPKRHIEMGSTLTTNCATRPVGSESAPHFNMSLWSWVRALTEAKEKGKGHAPIACEWDHPSSEWARGWGPYNIYMLKQESVDKIYPL